MATAGIPTLTFPSTSISRTNASNFLRRQYQFNLKQFSRKDRCLTLCAAHVSSSSSMEDFFANEDSSRKESGEKKWDAAQYEALIKGGEQVTSVIEEMAKLLEDMNMDEASEEVAVQLAAQGVIGRRVDELEAGFMMALDYMIRLAQKDQDDKRKSLLE